MRFTPHTVLLALVTTGVAIAGCQGQATTDPVNRVQPEVAASVHAPPPINAEPLSMRHAFTDEVAIQLRDKDIGRPMTVLNLKDPSHVTFMRFTVQPGVRFPWHSHPGAVLVVVTQGELVYVASDDCVRRPYPAGTAFIDPGHGHEHYAFNSTPGETVLVAVFLGVPATGPLTNPADAARAAEMDAKCNVT